MAFADSKNRADLGLTIDIPDVPLFGMMAASGGSSPYHESVLIPDIRAPTTPISPGPTSIFSPFPGSPPGPFSPAGIGGSLFSSSQGVFGPFSTSQQVAPIGNYGLFNSMTDVSTASTAENQTNQEVSGEGEELVKAVVEELGYISLHLRHGVRVDVAPNQAIRVFNPQKSVTLALTGCGTQMAMVHPNGRVLQYNNRIEVQVENYPSIKNAKMWPKGISFSSNNRALVYLVDAAGARSTTDSFHDLYRENIADTIFDRSTQLLTSTYSATIGRCVKDLEEANYWRTPDDELDCWTINNVNIRQTRDGLVTIDRKLGNELFSLRTSPSNGKVRLSSSFIYLTASMGDEAHVFVKSNERRIHYNGAAFVVRNAGHSAGFDETGLLRIW